MAGKSEKKETDLPEAMTEQELEDMLDNGASPSDTKERLIQFVNWRIQRYTIRKYKTLSAIFTDDFEQFTKEDFHRLGKTVIADLRECLRNNGVYVPKAKLYPIAQALADVVKEEIPWPPDDEDRPASKQLNPPQQQPYRPENAAPLPPQPAYRPESSAPILPLTPNYGPNYRVPHQLPSPHQAIQDFETKEGHGHSKELAALAKMYTSEEKYGGSPTENLSYKFMIFMDLCNRAEIPPQFLHIAFPTMLNSMALEYYYSSCQGIILTIQQLYDRLHGHFEGEEQYVAQRARGAYIATVSQPQAAFALSHAAQVTEPTYEDAQYLNRCLSWQLEGRGLTFVKLDVTTLRIVAFTDSSFANNKDLSSQIGYVIVLADAQNNANIIHWQSIKCRRVTRSVLASELYALSLGFDVAATIKSTMDHIFSGTPQGKIPLTVCIDSKSLYECLVKLGTTQEKRLMIDILCLRQSYERREITEILWVKGDKNPADAMTKDKGCDALQRLVDTNQLDLDLEGWVERQDIDQ